MQKIQVLIEKDLNELRNKKFHSVEEALSYTEDLLIALSDEVCIQSTKVTKNELIVEMSSKLESYISALDEEIFNEKTFKFQIQHSESDGWSWNEEFVELVTIDILNKMNIEELENRLLELKLKLSKYEIKNYEDYLCQKYFPDTYMYFYDGPFRSILLEKDFLEKRISNFNYRELI